MQFLDKFVTTPRRASIVAIIATIIYGHLALRAMYHRFRNSMLDILLERMRKEN